MTTIQSYFRPDSFTLVLRGRKVIVGQVDDVRDGDLKLTGSRRQDYLQVATYRHGRQHLLGGRWAGRTKPLELEVAERVLDTLCTLRAHDYFVALAALLTAEARASAPTSMPLVDAIRRVVQQGRRGRDAQRAGKAFDTMVAA